MRHRVVQLYEDTNMPLQRIEEITGVSWTAIRRWANKKYTKEYRRNRASRTRSASKTGDNNPMFGVTGESHPAFHGGVVSDGKGYTLVTVPSWYTGPRKDYIFEHHASYCITHGLTEIPKGYVVHHIDLDKLNNDPNNLIMLSVSDHVKLHMSLTLS